MPLLYIVAGSAAVGALGAYTLSDKVHDTTNIILIGVIAYLFLKK